MALEDQQLVCRDCGKPFIWTKGEQEFYQQKGFENSPTRCPECRKNKKRTNFRNGPRQSFSIKCSKCGKEDTVPFQPTEGREVYCRDCFQTARA